MNTKSELNIEVIRTSVMLGVILCFVFSGFAALLYQTAWMRQFSLVFGTSELAVAAVLSAYMGGLALGSSIAARYVHRVTRPVLFYGLLEAGIAASALAVPLLLKLTHSIYVLLFGGQPEPVDASGLGQSFFYLGTAFVVLAIPTTFMGATLPLLTKYFVQTEGQIGPRVGLLYATNTAGAVAGTIAAGFFLLPALGLQGTVLVGVAANLLVFFIAAWIAKKVGAQTVPEDFQAEASEAKAPASKLSPATPHGWAQSWILTLMLISGANSFVYEILWTRLLGHVLGGSVAAFATMLASFLSGIAIGSAIAARFATNKTRAIYGMVLVQVGIALASMLIYQLLPLVLPENSGLQGNAILAFAILFPATLFIGATYPFAVRIAALSKDDASSAAARVYAWNTVGAILGATLAAFFLIPILKYEGAIKTAVLINMTLAIGAALLIPENRGRRAAVALASVLAVFFLYQPSMPDAILRTSPLSASSSGDIRYYEVGRSATVIVVEENGYLNLRTNGLPEASTNLKGAPPYQHNQRLLSTLPVLARPDTENMLVIGFGAGVTLEGVPPSVKSIDVVELEPQVIAANQSISSERQTDPISDPRINIFINDARSALTLTNKRYDAIVSQPSHPWTAGASHLYTREFMALAKDHLTEDGVFLQWMNTQFVDEDLLRSLCATMLVVFDQVRVYQWEPEVLFFLGSSKALDVEMEMVNSGRPLVDNPVHFAESGIASVEDVVSALAMDHENVVEFAADAEPITDNFNLMATDSMRVTNTSNALTSSRLVDLLLPYDPLLQEDSWLYQNLGSSLNFAYISQRLESKRFRKRAIELSDTLIDRQMPDGLLLIGLGQARQNETEASERTLLQTISAAPEDQQARYSLLKPWFLRIARREEIPNYINEELLAMRGSGAAVIRGWLEAANGNLQELAELDSVLASVLPTDIWYLDSVKLRTDWRIKVTNPEFQPQLAIEAIRLIDNAIAIYQDNDLYKMRLAAAHVAGNDLDVFETARRLIYIYDVEIARAESDLVGPDAESVQAKLLEIDAVKQALTGIYSRNTVEDYKVRNLELAISEAVDRVEALVGN